MPWNNTAHPWNQVAHPWKVKPTEGADPPYSDGQRWNDPRLPWKV